MWRALFALFLLYHELFSECELFSDRELRDTHTPLALFLLYHELFTSCELHDTTLENFTMLPDAALLLHPM